MSCNYCKAGEELAKVGLRCEPHSCDEMRQPGEVTEQKVAYAVIDHAEVVKRLEHAANALDPYSNSRDSKRVAIDRLLLRQAALHLRFQTEASQSARGAIVE
jgi:hypothetical protein